MTRTEIQSRIDAIIDRLASPEMQTIADAGPYVDRSEFDALHAELARLDIALAQTADNDTEAFYVTVKDGSRTGWLLGPFDTHEEALKKVNTARTIAEAKDPRAVFYAFGTAKRTGRQHPAGILNRFAA